MTIKLEYDLGRHYLEVAVNCRYVGKYYPATLEQPAEWPDLEIELPVYYYRGREIKGSRQKRYSDIVKKLDLLPKHFYEDVFKESEDRKFYEE